MRPSRVLAAVVLRCLRESEDMLACGMGADAHNLSPSTVVDLFFLCIKESRGGVPRLVRQTRLAGCGQQLTDHK